MTKEVCIEPRLSSLATSFLRIGAGMFGGGYAMLPIIERELSDKRGWFSSGECVELFALAQMLPGVIAVNAALICGYRLKKIVGALVSVAAVVTVPIITILVIAHFFSAVAGNIYADRFLAGMKPAVVGLLFGTAFKGFRRELKKLWLYIPALVLVAAILMFDISPILLIFCGLAVGVMLPPLLSLKNIRRNTEK